MKPDPAPVPAPAPAFPMPAEDFLRGDHLCRADLVLMRGRSLFGRAIRFATRSPFSHAAMVFLVPQRDKGFDRTFLIESVPKGVSISDLRERVMPAANGRHGTEVAILRLEAPWFDPDLQALVRGHLMNFIRAGYDWRTILAIAWSLLRGGMVSADAFSGAFRSALRNAYGRKGLAPANFVCSGLVQYGFLSAIHDRVAAPGTALPPEADDLAIFNPALRRFAPEDLLSEVPDYRSALLATTPEDISRAPQLKWKYAIVRGHAHEIASRRDAIAAFGRMR